VNIRALAGNALIACPSIPRQVMPDAAVLNRCLNHGIASLAELVEDPVVDRNNPPGLVMTLNVRGV
jgi:hypothetical protein